MIFKPAIFIGSSKEGLEIAKIVADNLKGVGDCKLWTDAFDLGISNYDNLMSQIAFYDYAVLIATSDDVVISRGNTKESPRDNILFEFGMFAGGLGRSRVFFVAQKDVKLPSDLSGLTLPFIPAQSDPEFNDVLNAQIKSIQKHIVNKERTFDLGFLPSTALAYGYFVNFIERTVERLLEDKASGKVFQLEDGSDFTIKDLKITVLIPDDLANDMFKKVKAKRLRNGWQKMKIDPKDVRDYDFSIDISKVANGELHLVDIPLTLNALNKAIEIYSQKKHIGKDEKEQLLEIHEIKNFVRTLEYLIQASSITKGLVNIEVVDI